MRASPGEPASALPGERVLIANERPVQRGRYVLYWMIAARRFRFSFGLERALEWARHLEQPLIVLEPLRVGYPWASDRLHRFVLDGMADNERAFAGTPVRYYPYVEPEPGVGRGLLLALAERASLVVGDEFPAFFLPRMSAAAAAKLPLRLELVDSNGLVPLRATPRAFPTAYLFRRWLQQELRAHLEVFPVRAPLRALDLPAAGPIARSIERRWPRASAELLAGDPAALRALPIDHSVAPVALRGGSVAAGRMLKDFVGERLARYAEDRDHPDREGTSGLSPYLHFGHLSAHEVFSAVARAEGWKPERIAARRDGARGWFGMSPSAEAFLDQLVTWRELSFAFCHHRPDHERWGSLPAWARATLGQHAADPRPERYTAAQMEAAATRDPVWNAAQRQLLYEGRLHNYLRMLWGKKVLEWSASPRRALALLVHLNNKYALDGRDPNSYSGICWCLGRHDRPWGPERAIFGTVRYMSSRNTARKVRLARYLERHGADARTGQD